MKDINWMDEQILELKKQIATLSLELSRLERERSIAQEAAGKNDRRSLLQG